MRKATPSTQKHRSAERTSRQRSELGYGVSIAGHRKGLTSGDAIENPAPIIAQLSDCDFSHALEYHR